MLLWRYMSWERWVEVANDGRLPLSRIAGFSDGFECAIPDQVFHKRNGLGDRSQDLRYQNEAAMQRRRFASCWFHDEHESIAMWQLYVQTAKNPSHRGVALAMYFDDLLRLAPTSGAVSPVQYVRHDDANASVDLDNPDRWPFYKLWGFQHEREVRLVVPPDPLIVDELPPRGKWGFLRGTDLISTLRLVRVFTPRVAEEESLLAEARALAPRADVSVSRAYPTIYRHAAGEWWIEGMEPEPRWELRMDTHATISYPDDLTESTPPSVDAEDPPPM